MTDTSPTAQAVLLAEDLKKLREASGLTQGQVAARAGTLQSTVNKIERLKRSPPEPVLRLMLMAYGLDHKEIEEYVLRARQARKHGWLAEHKATVPHWFGRYVTLEAAASRKWTYEPEHIPGLLQTKRYTEAIVSAMNSAGPSDSAESLIEVRNARQQRLLDSLELFAILNEAVIHRCVGGPDVMTEQLEFLRERASLPNITVQIVPYTAGAHPAMGKPFTMLQFDDSAINTVYIEHADGAVYVDRPEDVQRYAATFERLIALAASEAETIRMIERTERNYCDG